LIRARPIQDARGCFSEIYKKRTLAEHGILDDFVQDNCSLSIEPGTVRGLHFQVPPLAQAKLVMVFSGRIFDVAVDCRRGSPTYGRHVSVELSREDWNQLFVPVGFAHGFCTMEPNTTVVYKVSSPYASEFDSGTLWNDPDLGIAWPVSGDKAVLSDKDRKLVRFRDLPPVFEYQPMATA
jgi:dTDP-4-dehydrorhamnose 3,5-epimerase